MHIESLQGKRWFIWTLVILLVSGVGLVTYIMTSGDDNSFGSTITHRIHKPVVKKSVAN
jgi:hypothetical protein